ncbi:hypothetical protein [Chryseobacterium sp. SIMBA_028]|uniref:hypothetical protein n=1 Tax=Chryseobacterium sp. SIMBA_028 TaxID=3085771 RepID=UPI00397DE99D
MGCVAFLQHSQQVSLYDARKQMLELDIWTQEEKDAISESHLIMMSDFRNDESEE